MHKNKPMENLRILVVDDNPAIHDDFKKILAPRPASSEAMQDAESKLFGEAPPDSPRRQFVVESAFQGQEAMDCVHAALVQGRPFAVVFLDVKMPPGWDGIETASMLWGIDPALQIVICTAHSDYSWDDITRKIGASDNLVILKKPFDNIEVLQLAHCLTRKWHMTAMVQHQVDTLDHLVEERTRELVEINRTLSRKMAECHLASEARRESEDRFERAFDVIGIPLAIQAVSDDSFLSVNEPFAALSGYSRRELIGNTPERLDLWVEGKVWKNAFALLREGERVREIAMHLRDKSGREKLVFLSVDLFCQEDRPYFLVSARPVDDFELEREMAARTGKF